MFTEKILKTLSRELAPKLAEEIKTHIEPRGIRPRYLGIEQAGEYMSTTPDAVRGMLRAKRFPARKIGERIYIDIKDIDKAMDENIHWLE